MIVSTGMSTISEIQRTYDALVSTGVPFGFTNCISEYPPQYSDVNLGVIKRMKEFLLQQHGIIARRYVAHHSCWHNLLVGEPFVICFINYHGAVFLIVAHWHSVDVKTAEHPSLYLVIKGLWYLWHSLFGF